MGASKGVSLCLLVILLISAVAAWPVKAAADPKEIVITDEAEHTKIQTDDYTIIFPRNGTKPMFIWWDNAEPEKVYVVHFKGLIEYAVINGGDLSLSNLSESTLFSNLVEKIAQEDQQILRSLEKASSDTIKAGDDILSAISDFGLGKNTRAIVAKLETTLASIQGWGLDMADDGLQEAIDGAIGALGAAIDAVEAGGNPIPALNGAWTAVAVVLITAIDGFWETVQERVEARGGLIEKTKDFHPAMLHFSSANWTIGEIMPIRAGGNVIGYNFTMNLTEAPKRFEFVEGNIGIAIRIYNTTVVENYVHYGEAITYNVTDGEMKMDLIISNWTWNFDPQTIELENSTSISISPALALWVDASCFNASGTKADKFFTDMDEVEDESVASTASFRADGTDQVIRLKDTDNDAKAIKFKPTIKHVKIAGKSFGMASATTITFDNETLGGFFEFIPYAILANATEESSEAVSISASYFAHGNHLRIYIKYPYFNSTLIHDPSIGIQRAGGQSPSYIVDAGQSGAVSVQPLPVFLEYLSLTGAVAAAAVALAGAVLFAIFARRHPTLMSE